MANELPPKDLSKIWNYAYLPDTRFNLFDETAPKKEYFNLRPLAIFHRSPPSRHHAVVEISAHTLATSYGAESEILKVALNKCIRQMAEHLLMNTTNLFNSFFEWHVSFCIERNYGPHEGARVLLNLESSTLTGLPPLVVEEVINTWLIPTPGVTSNLGYHPELHGSAFSQKWGVLKPEGCLVVPIESYGDKFVFDSIILDHFSVSPTATPRNWWMVTPLKRLLEELVTTKGATLVGYLTALELSPPLNSDPLEYSRRVVSLHYARSVPFQMFKHATHLLIVKGLPNASTKFDPSMSVNVLSGPFELKNQPEAPKPPVVPKRPPLTIKDILRELDKEDDTT